MLKVLKRISPFHGEDIEINKKIVKTPQNPPCIIVNYVLFLVRNKKVFFRAG